MTHLQVNAGRRPGPRHRAAAVARRLSPTASARSTSAVADRLVADEPVGPVRIADRREPMSSWRRPTSMRHRLTTIAIITGLALAACGSGSDQPAAGSLPPGTVVDRADRYVRVDRLEPADDEAGRGWLDGEPEWFAESSGEGGADGDVLHGRARRRRLAMDRAAARRRSQVERVGRRRDARRRHRAARGRPAARRQRRRQRRLRRLSSSTSSGSTRSGSRCATSTRPGGSSCRSPARPGLPVAGAEVVVSTGGRRGRPRCAPPPTGRRGSTRRRTGRRTRPASTSRSARRRSPPSRAGSPRSPPTRPAVRRRRWPSTCCSSSTPPVRWATRSTS